MTKVAEIPPDELGVQLAEEIAWLRRLEEEQGRPLRVLHVGNVAGNAYLNAKFMRRYGIEAHVLSYDYYYPIGSPEWEDGGTRPRWFVQGPVGPCARYLHALLDGRGTAATIHWWRLRDAAMVASGGTSGSPMRATTKPRTRNDALSRRYIALRLAFWSVRNRIALGRFRFARARSYGWYWLHRTVLLRLRSALRRCGFWPTPTHELPGTGRVDWRKDRLPSNGRAVADFDRYFPERADRVTNEEAEQWEYPGQVWRRLFERYDIVQGYGTDVIRPYASDARPYVGYEHGTLRDFTLGDDPVHRMTALAYRAADHVFITNGDCLEYAHRLGIHAYTPMIHPLDVDRYKARDEAALATLRQQLSADVILLCPLRHDWAIKGTDVHLRALPAVRAAIGDRTLCIVLTEWGSQIEESRALLDELGCADLARWLPPLERDDLISHMQAADVVLDQIALPHFGATAPQSLAAGTPVVMSYRPESTAWIVGEPAPILAAFEPADVAQAVCTALDPSWRAEFDVAAARWTRRWHHPDRIVSDHCRVYRTLLDDR